MQREWFTRGLGFREMFYYTKLQGSFTPPLSKKKVKQSKDRVGVEYKLRKSLQNGIL